MENIGNYKIIKIDNLHNEKFSFYGCEKIWISSYRLIKQLANYETPLEDLSTGEITEKKFPICKYKAIERILNFTEYLDSRIKFEESSELVIRVEKFKKYFTNAEYYTKYKNILHDLEVLTLIPYPDGEYNNFKKNSDGTKNLEDIRPYLYVVHNSYIDDDICIVFKKREIEKKNCY
ncbi:MAG: hypothetical protein ACEQSR_04285 [Candidatus Methylacidiphilales bacterium]